MSKILKTIPFTSQKYKEMQKIVDDLEAEREIVMKRLITAREMGDLSENGAYKYAKFELGDIGRQLRRYKELLAKGFVAPKHTGLAGLVDFGSLVTVKKVAAGNNASGEKDGKASNTQNSQLKEFMIVSEHESDPSKGTLSYSSPLGRELMRKKVGDIVCVKTPVGEVKYIVESVK